MAINRVDQAVVQLRAQLQRVAKERRKGASAPSADRTAIDRLREADDANRDDPEFRRAFVRAILLESLGDDLAQHPQFASIAADVTRQLDDDPAMRALVDQAIGQLG